MIWRCGPQGNINLVSITQEDVNGVLSIQGVLLCFDVSDPIQVLILRSKILEERLSRFQRSFEETSDIRQVINKRFQLCYRIWNFLHSDLFQDLCLRQ